MTVLATNVTAAPIWAGLLQPGYAHVHDPDYTSVDVARCGAVLRPADDGERLQPCPACHGDLR
ncbi:MULTISPECIES: hypothetical protein [Actinoalloteichus]|uniref:Uncharacterized protein n=1 Tax=Actinoalloteichus fjordicus TaxID=1612552 RepID=A0AAC9PRG2_9PSEU|nr:MULTISPECIES: hypothetical protein [Actinoalloteichus]APU14063.1 hypothetical protein UA74_10000 [Actinoalloteichus fjordicus]APU20010.1 hypothetical protein UA75_09975 [Actinoalloteichus sp. GBA129-24]